MQKFPKLFTVLSLVVIAGFLVLVILQSQISSPQLSDPPTVAPDMGFEVNIPQKALLRNYVAVSVMAAPGTICDLTFVSPSGETHRMHTSANSNGLCEWRWKIEESQGKGSGRLIFTIDGISETHFIEIRSSF